MKWWKIEVKNVVDPKEQERQGYVYAASASSATSKAPHWAKKITGLPPTQWKVTNVDLAEQIRATGFSARTIRSGHGERVEISHAGSLGMELQVRRDLDLSTLRPEEPRVNVPATGSLDIVEVHQLIEILQEAVAIAERMEDEAPTIHWTPEQLQAMEDEQEEEPS